MLGLQWFGFGFGDLLAQLDAIGFFAYVLPFLLIFAFSYALLSQIAMFAKNKGSAAIIAFALGFLALQLGFVSSFFQTIFPKFAMGLAVLLVALILMGVFQDPTQNQAVYKWIFFGLSAIIFLVIVISAFGGYDMSLSGFWNQYGAMLIVGALIIGAIVAVFVAQRSGNNG
jgi:hypothetical protein